MNKKGFTLIELLAAILLLGIIVGISSQTIVTVITNIRSKSNDISFQSIKSSANLYTKENIGDTKWIVDPSTNNEYTCVNVVELVNKGYIKESSVTEYKENVVKITRDSTTKAIIGEKIEDSGSCNTNLDLDVGTVTTTNNSITINGTMCKKGSTYLNNIKYKLDKTYTTYVGYDSGNNNKYTKKFPKTDADTKLDSNTEYKYYVKCSDGSDTVIKTGTAYTANFGIINISISPDGCTTEKEITLSSSNSNLRLYYKIGKNGNWELYNVNNKPKIGHNTTIYAAHSLNGVDGEKTNVTTRVVTNIDDGHIKIMSHNVSDITTSSAKINYIVDKSSICSKNYSYRIDYGKTTSYGNSKSNTTGASFNLTGLESGTKYYYKLTVTNNTNVSDSVESEFNTTLPLVKYRVNHYIHDLNSNTYTLNSSKEEEGIINSTLTLTSLAKKINGFTYVEGFANSGNKTKPTSGAVATATVLADGSRVINLYYRRNYLYIKYHVNGGSLSNDHGQGYGVSNGFTTYNGNATANKFLRGVYGGKVGEIININTYETDNSGLHNYNNPSYLNVVKNGYVADFGYEWNTKADGTGISYGQNDASINANGFVDADLSSGDKTVTLYINWVGIEKIDGYRCTGTGLHDYHIDYCINDSNSKNNGKCWYDKDGYFDNSSRVLANTTGLVNRTELDPGYVCFTDTTPPNNNGGYRCQTNTNPKTLRKITKCSAARCYYNNGVVLRDNLTGATRSGGSCKYYYRCSSAGCAEYNYDCNTNGYIYSGNYDSGGNCEPIVKGRCGHGTSCRNCTYCARTTCKKYNRGSSCGCEEYTDVVYSCN